MAAATCMVPTPLSSWAIPVGVIVLVLAFIHLRVAAAVMVAVCALQMLIVRPEIGWLTLLLGIGFVAVCAPGYGRWVTVLLAPYLTAAHLAVVVPLGLGVCLRRSMAWLWAAVAFLWCVAYALVFGEPRLGIPPIPHMETTLSELSQKPAVFPSAWTQALLVGSGFKSTWSEAMGFLRADNHQVGLAIQFVVWAGVAQLVAMLYVRRRLKDKLALEYLEKVTGASKPVPVVRTLPVAMLLATLAFVLGSIVAKAALGDAAYSVGSAVVDVLVAGLLLVPLWVTVEGNPESGKLTKDERNTRTGASFHELPVSDGAAAAPRARAATAPRVTAGASSLVPRPRPAGAGGAGGAGGAAAAEATPVPVPVTPYTSDVTRTRTTAGGGTVSSTIEAVMFIDMVGSTAMGSKYGDDYVFGLKQRLGEMVRQETRPEGVLFSKGTGDGYLLTFPETVNAARAALRILECAKRFNASVPEPRSMDLRIGIHMGQVNLDANGDRIGTAVNFASRIESASADHLRQPPPEAPDIVLPERNRIFVSEVASDELKGMQSYSTRFLGYFEFKGISGLQKVFELSGAK